MTDITQTYLVSCELYNWTPSLNGMLAYKRIVEEGYLAKWTAKTEVKYLES